MHDNERDENGRFAPGNAGGPGRPRRAIEREYLAVIGEAVTLDDWRDVVARAVADAKRGDHQARAWLGKYVIGEKQTLSELAAKEQRGFTPEAELTAKAADQQHEAERQVQFNRIIGRLQ